MTLQPSQLHSPLSSPKTLRMAAWAVFAAGMFILLVGQAAYWMHWIVAIQQRMAFRDGGAVSRRALAQTRPGTEVDKDGVFPYYPGVDKIPLDAIKDGTPLTRAAEYEPFYGLFDLLRTAKQSQLDAFADKNDAAGPLAFSQLLRQLDYYRGRLVRFRGVAKGIFEQRLPKNDFNIEKYYQIWASTTDSSEVVLIAALELPKGLRPSVVRDDGGYEQVDEPFEVVGFAYKRVVYNSVQAVTNTPMILAKTIDWHPLPKFPDPPPPTKPQDMLWYVGATFLASLVFVAGVSFYVRQSSMREARALAQVVEVRDWRWTPDESAEIPAPPADSGERPPPA